MAKRKAPSAALTTKPDPELVQKRTEGMTLLAPLKPLVAKLSIANNEDYLEADLLLGRIRNNRTIWSAKMAPIRDPIERAMHELKLSLAGVKDLDVAVDGPLSELERTVKEEMRNFKLREAQQRQLEEDNRRRESEQLRLKAAQVRVQESSAVTTQMRAKLAQKRAELDAAAAQVETVETAEVKGAMSTSRTVQRIVINDPAKFLKALTDYRPRAGVWEMGKPPLELVLYHTKRDGEQTTEGSALDKIEAELAKIHSVTPGIVESWPGVKVYDDIIIAGR